MPSPLYNHFLLTESQRERIAVVLVSPRNPLNIGAAARAMANFGFRRLAVVAPYEEHWREARSAVGAPELLASAQETAALSEAVADCTLVAGTGTPTRRRPEQPVVSLRELAPIVRRELARGGRVALIFGPEKRGLTRQDLAHCHMLVEIPTDFRQPSMNLGQAVAVCLYELAARLTPAEEGAPAAADFAAVLQKDPAGMGSGGSAAGLESDFGEAASAGELELLAGVVEETMLAANYSPAAMRRANRHDLHLLLRRLALNRNDARRILGLFRRVLWRLKHPPHAE